MVLNLGPFENQDDSMGRISTMDIPTQIYHNSKVQGENMGPIWGRQGLDGPHVGPINFIIWVDYFIEMES